MSGLSSLEIAPPKSESPKALPTKEAEKLPLPRGHRRDNCTFCGCERVFRKRPFDHSFHPILAVLTLGAWALVWFPLAMRHTLREPWRCGWCGHRRRVDYSPME